jgi:hypothetical protein
MRAAPKPDRIEPPASGRGAERMLPLAEDAEEQGFLREIMKESRRTTAREIERLYGPIELSE